MSLFFALLTHSYLMSIEHVPVYDVPVLQDGGFTLCAFEYFVVNDKFEGVMNRLDIVSYIDMSGHFPP